jgi:sodium/hydrogen antiporter
VIVVEESNLPHVQTILLTTYATVGLSVMAHGLTASPLTDRYVGWYRAHREEQLPKMESVPAAPHRPRGPIVPPTAAGRTTR